MLPENVEKEFTLAYCDTYKTLRINAGLRRRNVADKAGLHESSIANIEAHKSCLEDTLGAAIRALNELYYDSRGATVIASDVISADSIFS